MACYYFLVDFHGCNSWIYHLQAFVMNKLDKEVAEAIGLTQTNPTYKSFCPSTNWYTAGQMIEKYGLSILYISKDSWQCNYTIIKHSWSGRYKSFESANGATPQEAVCRAVIAMKEGET